MFVVYTTYTSCIGLMKRTVPGMLERMVFLICNNVTIVGQDNKTLLMECKIYLYKIRLRCNIIKGWMYVH